MPKKKARKKSVARPVVIAPKGEALTPRPRVMRVADIQDDPQNPNQHPERSIDALEASIGAFGQVEPLLVQAGTGRLIAGHGRKAAMVRLGIESAAVWELDVDDVKARALGIALNQTAHLSSFDIGKLTTLLAASEAAGVSHQTLGFSDVELRQMLRSLRDGEMAALDDPGAGEPPAQPTSVAGDVWVLGAHKIMCGNSTSPADMARLMDGETAVLLATDPPYLVDYDGLNHPKEHHIKAGRGGSSAAGGKHWDAYIDPESSVAFFADFLRVALAHCIDRVPVYQWHATKRQALVEAAWAANDLLFHQTIIWVKNRGVLTRSHYLWQHEPCFYGWRNGMMPEKDRRPDPTSSTVWEIGQAGEQDGIHPTQKPVEIFSRPMESHTHPGELVLEPFSGSGTQLIAAERTGRRCRAMELSPAFVDVAVVRWQGATLQDAVHAETRRTFAETALERNATGKAKRKRA